MASGADAHTHAHARIHTIHTGSILRNQVRVGLWPEHAWFKKIPAQQWLETQAMCCLGMCHGSHTLTGMDFSLHSTILKHQWLVMGVEGLYSITLSHEGSARKAKACRAGSHYLQCEINDLNEEKIPAQWWLEPQAMCCLGLCHGSHKFTGMEFSFAFYSQ